MQVTEHPKDVDFSGPEVNNDDEVFFAGGGQLTFADDDDGVVADVGGQEIWMFCHCSAAFLMAANKPLPISNAFLSETNGFSCIINGTG